MNSPQRVAGELHGGYTPEEAIVPVIVISRTHAPSTIIYTLPDTLKKSGGKARVDILFSDDVYSLEVDTTCGKCRCEKGNNSKTWKLIFTELNGEDATLNIYANGKLLPQKNVRITTSGIAMSSNLVRLMANTISHSSEIQAERIFLYLFFIILHLRKAQTVCRWK